MATKVLLIGLDAMDGPLVREWVGSGDLPNLIHLLDNSRWADTINPPGFLASVSVWPSFFTASDPSAHGRYAYRQCIPGTYRTRVISPGELLEAPFWETLSLAGKRLALLDVPSAPISRRLNGVQMAFWGPHDREAEFQTFPPNYAAAFMTKYGSDPIGSCDYGGRGPADFQRFRDDLRRRVETRLEFSRELLVNSDWDLFCTVFSEPHCVGHQAWHLHDPAHPRHDARLAARIGDPLRDLYVAIDRAIGELLECAGPKTRVMVYSSQGMGPANSGEHLIDKILSQRETGGGASTGGRLYSALFDLRSKIPAFVHQPFSTLKDCVRNHLLSGDWARRACYAVPPSNASSSCIRFNIAGRDPRGRMQPGTELERFVTALCRDLESLTDPLTGRRLVRRVLRTADIYSGAACKPFPDLLVEWTNNSPITAAAAPGLPAVEGVSRSNRTGDHTNHGFAIVTGKGSDADPRQVSVCDLAPTLTAWLDVQTAGFRGTPVTGWV